MDGSARPSALIPLRRRTLSRAARSRWNHPRAASASRALGGNGALERAAAARSGRRAEKGSYAIFEKLPKRTKALLAMPEKDRAMAIREQKKTQKIKKDM